MSLRLKQLSGRDVAAIFVRLGFQVVRTRGSHCKLRRSLPSGERQTLTIPLHASLATGTLHAIYRQACRFVAAKDLQPHFYTGETSDAAPDRHRPESDPASTGGRSKHER
jgi:predicted RNA binding protein YcfA (HicA-like mRNA interferase family)